MAREVWLETPPIRDDYQLAIVDTSYLEAAVKPKQFIHINESECILCAGCVDICGTPTAAGTCECSLEAREV